MSVSFATYYRNRANLATAGERLDDRRPRMSEPTTAAAVPAVPENLQPTAMWVAGPPQPDGYAAFRGQFQLDRAAVVDMLFWGESWFVAKVDGKFATEGPTRCEAGEHEAVAASIKLAAGAHVIVA